MKLKFPISKDGSLITCEARKIIRTFNLSNNILLEKITSPDYETNASWENVWKARCSLDN